jgi:hypothetical protein
MNTQQMIEFFRKSAFTGPAYMASDDGQDIVTVTGITLYTNTVMIKTSGGKDIDNVPFFQMFDPNAPVPAWLVTLTNPNGHGEYVKGKPCVRAKDALQSMLNEVFKDSYKSRTDGKKGRIGVSDMLTREGQSKHPDYAFRINFKAVSPRRDVSLFVDKIANLASGTEHEEDEASQDMHAAFTALSKYPRIMESIMLAAADEHQIDLPQTYDELGIVVVYNTKDFTFNELDFDKTILELLEKHK